MSDDSRQRFEAWIATQLWAAPPELTLARSTIVERDYSTTSVNFAWVAWQAAEKATAARCAEIAEKLAATYHAAYKSSYHQHDDGMCDGAGEVETAIRAAFPEAFK